MLAFRMNPNLYETGKICLSLLGTWEGDGSENWTSNSTMLQVIVSIQGLILGTPEPYFLEAGYESRRGQPDAMEGSLLYNQSALQSSLFHIMGLFRSCLTSGAHCGMEEGLRSVVLKQTFFAKAELARSIGALLELGKNSRMQRLAPSDSPLGIPLLMTLGYHRSLSRALKDFVATVPDATEPESATAPSTTAPASAAAAPSLPE